MKLDMNTVSQNQYKERSMLPANAGVSRRRKLTLKRLVAMPIKLLLLIAGLGVYGVLRLLYPLIQLRIGHLVGYDRIGEMSCRVSFYLRRIFLKTEIRGKRDIFISGKPANRQFVKMAQRSMCIIINPLFLRMYHLVRKYIRQSVLWIEPPPFVNYHKTFNSTPAPLSFNPGEEKMGRKLLERIGVGEGRPFVCIHARDKTYLDRVHKYRSRDEWAYHDYRDCNIDNYLLAAEYLASQGIYAIRMGHLVEKKLATNNPLIIDYALKYRTDFGDIYLSAKCKFFICSEGGLSCIPWAFNVPVVYTNGVPIGSVAGWRSPDIFIPKKFWSKKHQRFLNFDESINLGGGKWYRSEKFQQEGIDLIENTPQEILGAVKEMNERLDKKWVKADDEQALQECYRKSFTPDHVVFGYPSRVSDIFLRLNRNLLVAENVVR